MVVYILGNLYIHAVPSSNTLTTQLTMSLNGQLLARAMAPSAFLALVDLTEMVQVDQALSVDTHISDGLSEGLQGGEPRAGGESVGGVGGVPDVGNPPEHDKVPVDKQPADSKALFRVASPWERWLMMIQAPFFQVINVLSTHLVCSPCQYILSLAPDNTTCQFTVSSQPVNTSCQYILSIHPS